MSKYKAIKTPFLGRVYDSKAEAERAAQLKFEADHGNVRAVVPQPGTLTLGISVMTFRPDFLVVDAEMGVRYEDVKGMETARFKMVRKAWAEFGPCDLWVVRKKGSKLETEVVKGGGKWLETMAGGRP